MPMRSQAQRRYLWATNPEVAKKLEAESPKGQPLPDHVQPTRKGKRRRFSLRWKGKSKPKR